MALNALDVPAPISVEHAPFRIFNQSNFFIPQITRIITPEKVNRKGLTLQELAAALNVYPVTVQMFYASATTQDKFRKLVKAALSKPKTVILVNYLGEILGVKTKGHVSPIAAYNKKTDRFLILDVARYKYPPVWVKTIDLWKAISASDHHSKESRGFIILSYGAQPS